MLIVIWWKINQIYRSDPQIDCYVALVHTTRARENEKCKNKLSIFIAQVRNRCKQSMEWVVIWVCDKMGIVERRRRCIVSLPQLSGEGGRWRSSTICSLSLSLSIQPEDDDDDDVPSVIIITLSSACRCDMCLSHFQYEIFFATCFISPLLKGMLCSQGTRRGVCCARWLGETQVSCVMNGRERGTCSMNYALVLNDNLLASLYYYAAAHRRCVTVGCHRIGGDRW